MNRRATLQWLAAGSAALVAGGPAAGLPVLAAPPGPESWASFRNGNSQRGVATTTLPDKLVKLWEVEAGPKDGMITSTAAIVGDRVFAASLNGEIFALDRLTGRRLWTYRSRPEPDTSKFIPGFKAPVSISGEMLYLGDEEGLFHAVDLQSGKPRWTYSTNPDDPQGGGAPIVSGASFFDGKLLFGSHDNNLYCLDAGSGELVWKFATEGMVNCSPAIADGHTFVTGCDSHLRVIDVRTGKQVTDMPLGIYLVASPAVVDNMLYVGTHGGEVLAIDWKQARNVWTYRVKQGEVAFHSSAAVNDRFVIVGGQDKKLHCLATRGSWRGR
jgi:outer membrane protein assembly factor BamB